MSSKLVSRWFLLSIAAFVLVTVLSVVYIKTTKNTVATALVSVTNTIPASSHPELPFRLKIPKIAIDAHLESVGLKSKNEMDVPKDIKNAAWFNLGPQPGEKGSAVIDGHFGWKDGISAVFDNLSKLQKGDKIYVENEKGIVVSFVVRETKTFGENEDASAIFRSNDSGSHLNLITCGGAWNKTGKSYSNRLVVFADKENTF
jgi:sortase A